MNESGQAVGAAARFYKVDPEAVLVVHDEGDFDLGRLQLRAAAASPATTASARSRPHLQTQDFLRLRIGVGRPGRGDPRDLADYVLSDFEPEDDVDALVGRAADAVESLLREGLDESQRRFN